MGLSTAGGARTLCHPILRGLAARAPYFHNGSAADLTELLNFYDQRFSMKLTDEQKSELVAFLNSL